VEQKPDHGSWRNADRADADAEEKRRDQENDENEEHQKLFRFFWGR